MRLPRRYAPRSDVEIVIASPQGVEIVIASPQGVEIVIASPQGVEIVIASPQGVAIHDPGMHGLLRFARNDEKR